MDQSELLVILGGLYDKLVSDVAAHVNQKRSEALTELIDDRISEHKLVREEDLQSKMMDILANDNIDDQISNWMSNNFDLDNYSVDDAIESWMDNNLDDKVYDAVNSLTLIVEVSR
jgi:hypothetical protein